MTDEFELSELELMMISEEMQAFDSLSKSYPKVADKLRNSHLNFNVLEIATSVKWNGESVTLQLIEDVEKFDQIDWNNI